MTKLICVGCPQGCPLEVDGDEGARVSGARCKRGHAYAKSEVTDPRRTVTTTVRVHEGEPRLVAVRTRQAIPKAAIAAALAEMRGLVLEAPVAAQQVVLASVAGTGIPVVVTRPVAKVGAAKDHPVIAEY